jgi:hypothetical protein
LFCLVMENTSARWFGTDGSSVYQNSLRTTPVPSDFDAIEWKSVSRV